METRLAIISIIVENRINAESINVLLHKYEQYIVGRMGMPYEKKDLAIICILIDAPEDIISGVSGKLGMLQGVSVKTTYSKK
ncbi:MAG: TM1266 family iron-only hydrogenase system putative regulator [Bacillota bacterium]|jgi:putative iron-only hydrogenase system regulator